MNFPFSKNSIVSDLSEGKIDLAIDIVCGVDGIDKYARSNI